MCHERCVNVCHAVGQSLPCFDDVCHVPYQDKDKDKVMSCHVLASTHDTTRVMNWDDLSWIDTTCVMDWVDLCHGLGRPVMDWGRTVME